MTTIPTIDELYQSIVTDIETEFGIVIPDEGKSFLRALSAVEAAKLKLFYLGLANLQKNIWVDTADPVSAGGTLERFGFTKLGRYPNPATEGQYLCTVVGTAGAIIPALTQFKSDDDSTSPSYLFILDTAYTLTGTSDNITLRALTAGRDSVLEVGDTLTSTAPIINVNSQVAVSVVSVDPVAAETIEEYRSKAIQAYQLAPQGGAPADYRLWGLDAAGTRQIYPYAASGAPNEIDVFVEALPADSTDDHGTPTPTILADVVADIEADPVTGVGRRPLAVFAVNVQSIVPLPVDITINSGGTITAAQELLITQALGEDIYNIRPFIAGIDAVADRNDTISVYGVGAVIVNTIGGVIISSINVDVDGSGIASYTFDNGEIPYLNSVTYL
jgi:uncharacterized phage protein gp47/JayE